MNILDAVVRFPFDVARFGWRFITRYRRPDPVAEYIPLWFRDP